MLTDQDLKDIIESRVNKKKLLIIIALTIVFIIGIGVKIQMDKNKSKQNELAQAVKETQELVSQYLINNYTDIDKLEWLGWTQGHLGVYTRVVINDTQNDGTSDAFFYFIVGHPYIESYIDEMFDSPVDYKRMGTTGIMIKALLKQGVRKSNAGSPNAEIIYNLEEIK